MRYVLLPALLYVIFEVGILLPLALGPVTAYLSIVGWTVFGIIGLRYWQKHHLGVEVDGRLSDERMIRARERWIEMNGGERSNED